MKIENRAGDNISPAIEDKAGPSRLHVISTKVNFGRPSKSALPAEVRYYNIGHIVIEEENKIRQDVGSVKPQNLHVQKVSCTSRSKLFRGIPYMSINFITRKSQRLANETFCCTVCNHIFFFYL